MNVKIFRSWAIAVAIPLGLGALAGFITGAGRYETMYHPPLSPPAWLFPVAWSLLYVLMGTASWLVWRNNSKYRDGALKIYAMQLMVNLIWPFLFFSCVSSSDGSVNGFTVFCAMACRGWSSPCW